MGERGPSKTPERLHELRGTNRKDRYESPSVKSEAPKMPSKMPQRAKTAWKYLTEELTKYGMISKLDRLSLQLLCESVAIYFDAQDEIRKEGVLVPNISAKGINQGWKENPAIAVRNSAWKQIYDMSRQFGLTPSARTGMGDTGSPEDADVNDILFNLGPQHNN